MDHYLSRGFERDLAGRYQMPRTPSRPDGTVQIELVQSLFHSGKLSTRSKGLIQIEGRSSLRISPRDAVRFALVDGNRVRLSNSQGEVNVLGIVPQLAALAERNTQLLSNLGVRHS